jgi:hypothetical protein
VKRYFLIPIHITPLLLVATITFGVWIALNAGMLAIALGLMLLSWFSKYCFVLFDAVVAGEDEPPVLSMEMVNPISEQRPLALAAIIAAEAVLVARVGPAARWPAAAAMAVVLPAHIGVLGLTRNALQAVWPPALFALMSRLRWSYMLILAAMAVAGLVAYKAALVMGATSLIVLAVIELALLLIARSNGEALLVVEQRLASNSAYRLAPTAVAVRMAELAGAAGKKGLQRRLAALRTPENQQPRT